MRSRNETGVTKEFELSAVQVGTTSTLLGTVDLGRGAEKMSMTIDNNGGQTINAFSVVRYNHADDAGYTYLSGADWADPDNPNLIFASSTANYTPTDLDDACEAQAVIRVDGAQTVKLYATAAAAQDTNGTIVRGLIY